MSSEIQLPPNVAVDVCQDLTGKVKYNSDIYKSRATGGMADVFEGDYNGRTVAVKVIRIFEPDKIQDYRRRFVREAKAWTQLSSSEHTNVLQFIGVMNWQSNRPALISLFQKNGTVLEYIAKNEQADRHCLVLGVASGLQYIHEEGAVHGDLKSNNVLIDDCERPLISDFGQSRLVGDADYTTYTMRKQNRMYTAPEIFIAQDEDLDIDAFSLTTAEADVYTFSITAFEILHGTRYLFRYRNIPKAVVERGVRPPEGVISECYFALLVQCWEAEPSNRLRINDVVQELGKMRQ
ncbi:hypothetical protein APHAL10511_004134 [Amanita phalloides]|nr:hypothetical protein APHAL10511_004134 [Amanita phalloides]